MKTELPSSGNATALPREIDAGISQIVTVFIGDDDARRNRLFRFFCDEAMLQVVELTLLKLTELAHSAPKAVIRDRAVAVHRWLMPTGILAAVRDPRRRGVSLDGPTAATSFDATETTLVSTVAAPTVPAVKLSTEQQPAPARRKRAKPLAKPQTGDAAVAPNT